MKKVFEFGKIKYTNELQKVNLVTVEVELNDRGGQETFTKDRLTGERIITGKTPGYKELSICGYIWNPSETDCVCGGQCLDTIAKYKSQLNNPDMFSVLYYLWENYHLNGLNAGTPEQETAVKEWTKTHKYKYEEVCEVLKEKGLYTVNYTGLSVGKRYENEPYTYGQGWIIRELPDEILALVQNLLAE